jgi:hypothetical protein
MWVYTRNNAAIKRELVNLSHAGRICLSHEGDLWRVDAYFPDSARVHLTDALPERSAIEIIECITRHLDGDGWVDLNPIQ